MTELPNAALLLVSVWIALVLGGWATGVGHAWAGVASFVAACLMVLGTRGRRLPGSGGPFVWLLGLAAGAGSYAAWVALIAAVGLGLGLAPPALTSEVAATSLLPLAPLSPLFPLRPPALGVPQPAAAMATLVLAPVFEELLYRERLFDALGGLPVLWRTIVTSGLFAVTHIQPWPVLGTFLVGLALASTRHATSCIGLCIALHAGLNLGALIGPVRFGTTLVPGMAAIAYGVALVVARRAHARDLKGADVPARV